MCKHGTGKALLGIVAVMMFTGMAGAQGEPPDMPKKGFLEQSIYIPYEELKRVFEKEGRGVFLPYEQFHELWEAAKAKAEDTPMDPVPSVDALVSEVLGQALVQDSVVHFKAKIRLDLIKTGWCEIPLGMRDVAVLRAQIGKDPARLAFDAQAGYSLLLDRPKDSAGVRELDLEFAKAYERAPGLNSVTFETPRAPVSRWDITIPEPGVKVNVYPLIAAAEQTEGTNSTQTCVSVFVGAAPTVKIEWSPKSEGAKGLDALAQVQAAQGVVVEEGVMRVNVQLTYTISRAALSSLEVEVPSAFRIVNVYDPNVREWSVREEGETQRIMIQLFESAEGTQGLILELEKYFEKKTDRLVVPVVHALHMGRQQGFVALRAGAGLRVEAVDKTGLFQVSETELPKELKGPSWTACYRYSSVPYTLAMSLEEVKPRIEAQCLIESHVLPETLRTHLWVLYDVQRAGLFQFEISLPQGLDVQAVDGVSYAEGQPVQVEAYHVKEEGSSNILVVDLSQKALGHMSLRVQLQRELDEQALMRPTGQQVQLSIPIPRLKGVDREEGHLVVYGKDSLRLNPAEAKGLRPISQQEALRSGSSHQVGTEALALAYAYGQAEAALTITAERRRPYVTVAQLLVVGVELGVAKFEATLFYDVLYSAVDGIYLDLPEALAKDKLRLATSQFERQTVSPLEESTEKMDLPSEGYVRWKITGASEISGSGAIQLLWEEKIEKLDSGKSTQLLIPRLNPCGVDRTWGQIVLSKAETMDVSPSDGVRGLRPIDPQTDMMHGRNQPGAARAYEFHADWQLGLDITRYELKEVKATSVERGLVRMVLTKGGATSVQAIYLVKSARQRLAFILPVDVSFDSQPCRINGVPVSLEQGDGQYHVPLLSQDPESLFLLELRYALPKSSPRLECPSFPGEPAMQRIYLSVYLPENRDFLGYWGPWIDENIWAVQGFSVWPRASQSDAGQIQSMAQGISLDVNAILGFPTEGKALLFSSLRPPAGKKGSLRLVSVRGWLLDGFVLMVVVGGGLLLLPTGFAKRCLAMGSGAVALIFLAVFFPTLARQVADGVLLAGGVVVLILWTLWYLLVTRPKDPQVQIRRERRRQKKGSPPPLRRNLDEAWKQAEQSEKRNADQGEPHV